jgi:putative oxidoreductase
MLKNISIIFILILFIISGFKKLFNFNSTAKLLKSKFPVNLPLLLHQIAIIGVIILLTIGSFFLIYSSFTDKFKKISCYIIICFIIFTVTATIMFHPPTDKTQQIQFMKNISIIGAFLLLLSVTSRGINIF